MKSYRENENNSIVKLSNRIDFLFIYLENNYTKIFYAPLVVLLVCILMKLFGYIKLDWSDLWVKLIVSTIIMYFVLGVSVPVMYGIFRKKTALILIGFLLIYIVDFIMNFDNNLIETVFFIFCYTVGGFFAILNFRSSMFSFFQYVKNKTK